MILSRLFQSLPSRRSVRRVSRARATAKRDRRARLDIDTLERRELLTGTWTLTNFQRLQPIIQTSQLLSDGSVLLQGGSDLPTNMWYRLTPDSAGNYADGTVTQLPNSGLQRLFYTSDVLKDGRFYIAGGEYTGPVNPDLSVNVTEDNTAEIYDPVANTWHYVASFPESKLGDAPSEVMPNGEVYVGSPFSSHTYFYNPTTNTWRNGPDLLNGDTSSEEGWVKLPDGSILSYSITGGAPQTAERYVPSLNQWVSAGSVPVPLATKAGNEDLGAPELGPGVLLPDGRVFWIGATNHTALYTPPTSPTGTGSWTAGPDIPGGLGAFDAPAAVEPDGNVLFTAQILDGGYNHVVNVFEYYPATNQIIPVSLPAAENNINFISHLQVLPNGQILYLDSVAKGGLYTADPATQPSPAWAPTVTSISTNFDGTYTITGTQLNGLSEGSTYGDDAENASNFPIVRLTTPTGDVQYARTLNWSSTGVQTGVTPVSAAFSWPSSDHSGAYLLNVIANGIASVPYLFVQPGTNDTSVTLQTDPLNGDYQVLFNGASVDELAPGSFTGVFLNLGAATLNVSIRETPAGVPVRVSGNPFTIDTITLGDQSGVQNILGSVYLDDPTAFNTIVVSDAGDVTGRVPTVSTYTDDSGNNWGSIVGLAPGAISYKLSDTASPISITGGSGGNTFTIAGAASNQTINLDAGTGSDTVNVTYTLAPLNIDGGGGNDQVNIGSNYTGGINGAVHVTDTGGAAAVLVDDHLDTGSNTVTVDDGQLTGLSPAAITWTPTATGSGGVASLHVLGGTGSDTWNVVNTSNFGPINGGGTTWLQTGNGGYSQPTVNVQRTSGGLYVDGGSSIQNVIVGSTGNLLGINGFVSVYNSSPSGSSALSLNDTSDTTARTVAVSDGLIIGLASAPLYWTDNTPGSYTGGVAALRIYGGSGGNTWNIATDSGLTYSTYLTTGSGQHKADTVNLQAAPGSLTIDGANDNVTVNIGSLAPARGERWPTSVAASPWVINPEWARRA